MSSVKNIPKSKLLKKGGSFQDMLAIMTYKSKDAGVKSALCDMLCRKSPVNKVSHDLLKPEYIGAMATMVGFMGGFPAPPRIFQTLTFRYETLQWLMVYVLIWQGGGGQDYYRSAIVTAVAFALKLVLDAIF
eukprot:jgi/Bigna1/129966/aug1.10_g4674